MYNLPESPGVCRENFLQRCLLCGLPGDAIIKWKSHRGKTNTEIEISPLGVVYGAIGCALFFCSGQGVFRSSCQKQLYRK